MRASLVLQSSNLVSACHARPHIRAKAMASRIRPHSWNPREIPIAVESHCLPMSQLFHAADTGHTPSRWFPTLCSHLTGQAESIAKVVARLLAYVIFVNWIVMELSIPSLDAVSRLFCL